MSQTVAPRRSRLCLSDAHIPALISCMIAAWRVAVGVGSLLRALRHFSASLRESARKLSRAIKMPLMRHATLVVLWHVFLSQHFSCSDFCRARPLPAWMRAHMRMSAPSRRTRPRVTANPSDNGIHQKAVAQSDCLCFSPPLQDLGSLHRNERMGTVSAGGEKDEFYTQPTVIEKQMRD